MSPASRSLPKQAPTLIAELGALPAFRLLPVFTAFPALAVANRAIGQAAVAFQGALVTTWGPAVAWRLRRAGRVPPAAGVAA